LCLTAIKSNTDLFTLIKSKKKTHFMVIKMQTTKEYQHLTSYTHNVSHSTATQQNNLASEVATLQQWNDGRV